MSNATSRSQQLFERALQAMPGGVSSPVRAFRAVGGTPLFVDRAEGAQLTDVDGNTYLDFVMSWGPLILGHAYPKVTEAIAAQVTRGTTYGAPHLGELELAELVRRCYPTAERVRFTSSGTEAAQSALRLARAATGRSRIVKFDGCYHGHCDAMLVAAGSGAITFGEPSSAGVPSEVAGLTSVVPLDDEHAIRELMKACGHEVAVIAIEPIPANNGLLLQRKEFLQLLRELCDEHGALLLFDEVISGFRVGPGGAAAHYGIEPDLVAFGKILGGGLPCAAFGGPAEVMSHLAPLGKAYHAGTLSGNPLAMAAGLAQISELADGEVHRRLEALGQRLQDGVEKVLCDEGLPVRMVRQGSLFWFSFSQDEPPRRADRIPASCAEPYAKFFHACLQRGVHLAPSAYEVGFLSTAHTEHDIDRAVEVFTTSLREALA
jgi:glutamate-1-semialdehyde 2,1-aminomutase